MFHPGRSLAPNGRTFASLWMSMFLGFFKPRTGGSSAIAHYVISVCCCLFLTPILGVPCRAADLHQQFSPTPNSAVIIGFVGGFVRHDDTRHAEVQLANRLRSEYGNHAYVNVFENRNRESARTAVLQWLDKNSDGALSRSEKGRARIVLYGHSWGGSAVIALARELQKDEIPVLLTIQVDSISKLWQDDHTIPANVSQAVNFYQTGGPLHGDREIVAADPARTKILGDFRFDYEKQPEPCSSYPWFARHFLKGHTSIECDPNVWSQIEALISEKISENLPSIGTQAAAVSRPPSE
ncbi:MAG TPA: hypothetical protein VJ731_13245 [Terriglobales bacterium]|nr:hypothetical protein [Terriglobales bacterium]